MAVRLRTSLDSPFDSDSDSVFSSDSYHPREERLKEKLAQAQAEAEAQAKADLQGMIKQEHPYYIDMDSPSNHPPIHLIRQHALNSKSDCTTPYVYNAE